MDTNFEELDGELENVVGGLFDVDTVPASKDFCSETCNTYCVPLAVGTRNGTTKGVVLGPIK